MSNDRKVTGSATIRVNGTEWRTEVGATLNPGGVKREAIVGAGGVVGYKETPIAPELSCKVIHTPDVDLIELGKITDATVIFESDNGDSYVLVNAFNLNDGAELDSSSGTIPVKFSGLSCERV